MFMVNITVMKDAVRCSQEVMQESNNLKIVCNVKVEDLNLASSELNQSHTVHFLCRYVLRLTVCYVCKIHGYLMLFRVGSQ